MNAEVLTSPRETTNQGCVDSWIVMDARLRAAKAGSLLQQAAATLAELDMRALPKSTGSALQEATELLTEAMRPLTEARRWLERTE